MKNVYKEVQTSAGSLVVRPYGVGDIPAHAAYLYDSPREFLEEIGFDTSKLPSRAEWVQSVEKRVADADSKKSPDIIVGEIEGRTLGMLFYDTRNKIDPIPRLHFHIFDIANRGRGLGGPLFIAAVEEFRRIHGVERFMIEPKQTNKRMNGLMRKLGYVHLKDVMLEAGPLTHKMLVSQYEVR